MYYFIVNRKSRGGKGLTVWREVQTVLDKKEVSYKAWETKYEGHAKELAEKISGFSEQEICLIVVGGDGTINEVLNGIKDFERIRFGVIATGSGNDFGAGLGITGTPTEVLEGILNNNSSYTIDLGQVRWNGCEAPRLFAISAGVGLDAIVCKKALHSKLKQFLNKIHLGKLTYLLLTVQSLFSMKTGNVSLRYRNKEAITEFEKVIFAAAMNLKAEGGGVPMAPKADFQDGKLSVCLAWGIPKWRTFFCLPLLVLAKHEKIKGFGVFDFDECSLHMDRPMVLHADGEYCGDVTDVTFTCFPNKLRIINERKGKETQPQLIGTLGIAQT